MSERLCEFVGVAESAEILGVSKQRVNQLAVTEAFPQPVARLRAGPVWRRADVQSFGRSTNRTTPPEPDEAEVAALADRIMDLLTTGGPHGYGRSYINAARDLVADGWHR